MTDVMDGEFGVLMHSDDDPAIKEALDSVQDLKIEEIQRFGRYLSTLTRLEQSLTVAEVAVRKRDTGVPTSEVRLAFLGATDAGKVF
jgi:hypothetical protein